MRIGLNLLYLLPGVVGGTETYAAGLLQGLAAVDDQLEYIVFVNQESANWPLPAIASMQRVVCPVRATNRMHRLAFEQFRLPGLVRRHGLDLLHSLGYVAPLATTCPSVVTIHDMNTKGHGQSMPLSKRLPLSFLVRRSGRAARMVITVSEFSRREIHAHLGLPLERIQVVHEAPLPADLPLSGAPEPTPVPATLTAADERYILAFASQSLHKNIPRLIEAFARIAPSFPHKLVLAGHLPSDGQIDKTIQRWDLAARVRLTGFLPRPAIRQLLADADLFVFPSLYEGFGLPLLEAQALGTAVACSDRGALPEIAGDSAAFFDPENVLDMAATLGHALGNGDFREQLVHKGTTNLTRFSWTKAARRTLEIYAEAAWRGSNRYVRGRKNVIKQRASEHGEQASPSVDRKE